MATRLHDWKLKSVGSRTYFFDLKEASNGNTFLQITESRPRGEGEDGFEQSRLFVFSEDYESFFKSLGDVYRHLKAHPEQMSPPGRRQDEQRRRGSAPAAAGDAV